MKLYRSQRDKKLFGLCGGLAEVLNVDATLLRLVFVITAIFSGGTVIFLYIVASLVIPKEPVFNGSAFNYPPPPPPPGNSYQGYNAQQNQNQQASNRAQSTTPPPYHTSSNIDERMEEIEKKAMWKEIEELKSKLAEYEKEDK